MLRNFPFLLVGLLWVVCCAAARGQSGPRINALFPAGARAGETVEVAVRGGNLNGAREAIITGAAGVTAQLLPSGAKVDESAKPISIRPARRATRPALPRTGR